MWLDGLCLGGWGGLQIKVSAKGVQVVLIGDIIDIPLIDVTAKAFQVEISDWSTKVIIPTASKRKASLTLLTLVRVLPHIRCM